MKKYDGFAEPDLDIVLGMLKKENGYTEIKSDIEHLYQILYYFEEDQTASFYKKITEFESKDDFKNIFENLAYLYPLSKHILIYIIDKNKNNDEAEERIGDFLDVYAQAEGLSDAFNRTLLEIKKQRKGIPSRIKECEEKIADYEKEKEETRSKIDDIRIKQEKENLLAKEVKQLQDEVDKLEQEYSDARLKEKKRELSEEKRRLEANKREYADYEKELNTLLQEVDAYTNCGKSLKILSEKSKKLKDSEV
ncbi:hypothetical protein [Treponema sp.]|uniref:hypothetical protein n=1 Tax=Treponema sp. TaxID=166 RepID=UPI003FA20AC7